MDDNARKTKLGKLLAQLNNNQHASNREIRKALGDSAYAELESAWQEQLDLRKQLKDKPDEIRDYEAKLKRAIFLENRAEGARSKKLPGTRKLADAAEAAFDKLYEHLGEIIEQDGTLSGWFDRNVHFDTSNFPDLSSKDAPRVVTAKSGAGYASGIRSKRDTKIAAIEHELDELGRSEEQKAAVAARLAKSSNSARLGKR